MASPTEKPTTGTGGSIPGPGDGGLPHHHQNQNQNQNQSPPSTSHRTGLRIRDWVRSPASGETRHHHDDPTSTTSTPSATAAAAAAAGPDSDPAPERHRAPRHDPCILPALAFSLDMFNKTGMQYGVNEVLLASVLGAVVFSVLACQPLVIVGVTGPITVFNYTVYDIMMPTGTNYLAFMCWIGIWSLIFHWILAVTNSCNWLRYVTRFPCDIFGFYVAFIYLQKGIQILETLGDHEPFYLSVVVALLVFAIAYICGELGQSSLFKHPVRVFLKDYGTPLTVVFFTGFAHMGKMKHIPLETLPTGIAFMPTVAERGWFVHFWDIPVGDIFIAIPFAVLLTILFWFDHNVSSLIAQGTEFPLRKPAGFHWDLFLLGLTTGIAGLLGLPFPNGLIPQAPFHTESLCVTEVVPATSPSSSSSTNTTTNDPPKPHPTPSNTPGGGGGFTFRATHVVEQRLSNLAQGLLTLVAMTGPLLTVLHLIPQGVLAGLFFIMGFQALAGNGITAKVLFLARDRALTEGGHPLLGAGGGVRRDGGRRWGFPVVIFALISRAGVGVAAVVGRRRELAVLDEPTASPFTMESVGGSFGGPVGGGGGGVLDDRDDGGKVFSGESGEETERVGRKKEDEGIGGRGGGRAREGRSDEELAELGESRSGVVRRRLSTLHREGSA
ncbi:hypothetical protein CHGG_02419 [Chaetomium globosum CBS 148.51]|uniref:Bicarbonate transporter-like transmembrane domain-containing protein n=1 Tax=Chaetomium globosum (strain ATCC 6205 / CBS 148.51 / DSM 1962 / NBRC 6347 / NRRL 1970) TaxID=306901 RepID=Q2HBI5_CHAGB|nr:uncharacterized protein CHGG_02419 [Chaetomium globosum CBS 148.51]EAQ90484.1 hypothetical protein CHGG_02419 [Chaetomium globosum CBS 148.51]